MSRVFATTFFSSDGLPNANAQRVKDAQPMIRAVGQEAHLTCPAEGARGVLGEAKWEKVGGELPYAYSVRNGVLVLKDLARSDGGVYKCTLQTESGMATVTHINLQVSDFVPSFDGAGFVKLKPMTIDEWENVNIKLSVKPKMKDGLILYTSRQKGGEQKTDNFISVGLRKGKVVYRYDVGNGPVELESSYPVRVNEWHRIELRNNKAKAALYVDGDDVVEKKSEVYAISEAPSTNISIGGLESLHSEVESGFTRGLDGTVKAGSARLLYRAYQSISGKMLSRNGVLWSKAVFVQSTPVSMAVSAFQPMCTAGSHATAIEPTGTKVNSASVGRESVTEGCRDSHTKQLLFPEKCVVGSCLKQEDGTHSCLCPYGRTGRLCDQFDDEPLRAISFNGENSFLSLPPPTTLRNYTLEMLVRPRDTKEQLVAYVGSEYDPKRSNFMGIAIRNGKFVHVYNNGDGNVEMEGTEAIEDGSTYKVELKRMGQKGELRINGKKVASKSRLAPFQAATDLFIGGLPPGVVPHRRFSGAAPLNGCIYKV
ncbi:unnamed protein product [Toxocara canis]|uniref:Basement membrane-specific heparan sulfate proteoglycan core protein n=1 Tax=Toxocara canis TaxID=6265 RepID=A0A183UT24_TOXCA|nr:unnamed protein product [Toxocara canis]